MKRQMNANINCSDERLDHLITLLKHFAITLRQYGIITLATFMITVIFLCSCSKFVEVEAPKTSINQENVFSNDATATAILTGIYIKMSGRNLSSIGGISTIPFVTGLSGDELILYNNVNNPIYIAYYQNSLTTSNVGAQDYWNELYKTIYTCNSAIEGLDKATSISPIVKKQLLGESKFIRALNFFYLLNLYGDLPITRTTDYSINGTLNRSPKSQVYELIIQDLLDALNLLTDNYVDNSLVNPTSERVRPNVWAAKALLARVYLYNKNYVEAENMASQVINNTALYHLNALNEIFLKNSAEAIWQLQPVNNDFNTEDARFFIIPQTGLSDQWPVYLSQQLLSSFETGDRRKTQWLGFFVDTTITPHKTYYYPFKYKVSERYEPVTEYATVLRLGEQYLIRAEARAQLGKLTEAADDLYSIRERAGLGKVIPSSQLAMLEAILHERQVELFTEWGHRWLDLKRFKKVDEVMTIVTPLKGGVWSTNWQLYPIPEADMRFNPNIIQNPGY